MSSNNIKNESNNLSRRLPKGEVIQTRPYSAVLSYFI